MSISFDDNERLRLLGSLRAFTETMYFVRNGRKFETDTGAIGRESHYLIVMRELSKIFRLQNKHLVINLPPSHGKSTMCVYFIAWCFAHYSDCKFIYVSYSSDLAEGHTAEIKAIMQMSLYQNLFSVKIDPTSSARGDFRVLGKYGTGRCTARGSASSITGLDAGMPFLERFSGMVMMDDMHKMSEVHSDTKRDTVLTNYNETIKYRPRGVNVGMVYIGQRGCEGDLADHLLSKGDGIDWRSVILAGLDEAENALAPSIMSKEQLLRERDINPYAFHAQIQQRPQPSGGSVFKDEWFKVLYDMPEMEMTFVVGDTAESQSTYADSTVFTFFGLYKIRFNGEIIPGKFGLHVIACREVKIEPKDLEREFFDFWTECLRFQVQPTIAAIEKKSTGSTLVSVLSTIPGLRVIPIEHNADSGSKSTRFLECQRYVADGLISLSRDARHTDMFISHMSKITANNTHKHDDIADTLEMAIRLTFIDKVLISKYNQTDYTKMAQSFGHAQKQFNTRLRGNTQFGNVAWK